MHCKNHTPPRCLTHGTAYVRFLRDVTYAFFLFNQLKASAAAVFQERTERLEKVIAAHPVFLLFCISPLHVSVLWGCLYYSRYALFMQCKMFSSRAPFFILKK